MFKAHYHYSVHGILNWEHDVDTTVHLHAHLDHHTIVVIEEKTPESNLPAAKGGLGGIGVDEEVPDIGGKGFNETGRGCSNHKGGHDDGGGEGLFLVFVHFNKLNYKSILIIIL